MSEVGVEWEVEKEGVMREMMEKKEEKKRVLWPGIYTIWVRATAKYGIFTVPVRDISHAYHTHRVRNVATRHNIFSILCM